MNILNSKILAVVSLFLMTFIAATAGTMYGHRLGDNESTETNLPVVLNADSAARSKSMSMATGVVDVERGIEGLFVLDHLSGNLQCWVLNPRTGEVAGIYTANVNEDLELGKGGDLDYVMTTGSFRAEKSTARRGNQIPSGSICYVGDGNSGKVVGYILYFNRQLVLNNGTQRGKLEVLARGLAREAGLKRDN